MFVISGVPDFAGELFADGVRISAFDELDTAGRALIDCWGDEDVEMVGHDRECMECEFALVAIAEECSDHELGVLGALEYTVALMSEDGNGVGALLLADGSHAREHTPGAKAPQCCVTREAQG